jgi:hypothetical protein
MRRSTRRTNLTSIVRMMPRFRQALHATEAVLAMRIGVAVAGVVPAADQALEAVAAKQRLISAGFLSLWRRGYAIGVAFTVCATCRWLASWSCRCCGVPVGS